MDTHSPAPPAVQGAFGYDGPEITDAAAYWLIVLDIYVLVGFLWYYGFKRYLAACAGCR